MKAAAGGFASIALVLWLASPAPAAQQQPSNGELRQEIQALQESLKAIQKELEPWTPHVQAIGLDVAAFDACVASDRLDAAIRRDIAEAQKLGITGTPAFLIGRTDAKSSKLTVATAVRGARPFAEFKAEIDKVLAEAEKPAVVEAPPGR